MRWSSPGSSGDVRAPRRQLPEALPQPCVVLSTAGAHPPGAFAPGLLVRGLSTSADAQKQNPAASAGEGENRQQLETRPEAGRTKRGALKAGIASVVWDGAQENLNQGQQKHYTTIISEVLLRGNQCLNCLLTLINVLINRSNLF